jgi:predicted metal-binding membrane protein
MMLPSAAPMILLHASLKRMSGVQPGMLTGAFLAGYLAIWAIFSMFSTGLQWGLGVAGRMSETMMIEGPALAGGVLILAGLYQFTSLKHACLAQCQSPAGFLVENHKPGRSGAFKMGIAHGAFCLGCCWALMALLFVGGVMNLTWIAGLAILVAIEKLSPFGTQIVRIAGGALIVWGLLLFFSGIT